MLQAIIMQAKGWSPAEIGDEFHREAHSIAQMQQCARYKMLARSWVESQGIIDLACQALADELEYTPKRGCYLLNGVPVNAWRLADKLIERLHETGLPVPKVTRQ